MKRAIDWPRISEELDAQGSAVIERLMAPGECASLAALYADGARFRSRVVMARHGFGRGEYQYFRYPLPEPIGRLRTALYPHLAAIANRWNESMGMATRFPGEHAFPLQLTVLLSEPGRDFTGGEFVMTEQRPRMQSRAQVVPLAASTG
jgi:uncharacterized protein